MSTSGRYNKEMRSPAVFRWLVVGNFATVLIVALVVESAHAEGLEEETSRLVERLNFRSSDKEFTFPAGPDEVREICERLYNIGPEARSAIPTLIRSLADDDRQWSASLALVGMGGEAVPALRRALKEAEGDARCRLVQAIEELGRDAYPAIPDLVNLLRHDDSELRHAAIDALAQINFPSRKRVIGITTLLEHESEDTRAAAFQALRRMKHADLALPHLVELATTSESPDVRADSLSALANIDLSGEYAAEVLVNALNDNEAVSSRTVGDIAAYELAGLGRRSAPAVPALIELCNRHTLPDNERTLQTVIDVFAYNPKVSAQAEPFLRRTLAERFDAAVQRNDDQTIATCVAAANALLRMKPLDRQARDVVISILEDPRWKAAGVVYPLGHVFFPDPRPRAAEAVVSLGPKADNTLPALKGLLAEGRERNHERLATRAAWAIAQVDPNDNTCTPEVIQYIQEYPFPQFQSPSKFAQALKTRLDPCLPALLDRMFNHGLYWNEDRWGESYLVQVIIALGDEATSQVIGGALKAAPRRPWERSDEPWRELQAEFNVLPLLGEHAKPAVPRLLSNLRDPDHYTRARSAEMLGRLTLDADKVVPELIARLSDERAIVRARAAAAFGRFGTDAISAVKPLQTAERDSYLVVRSAARQSLSMLQASRVK